jgi:hypothetical protein
MISIAALPVMLGWLVLALVLGRAQAHRAATIQMDSQH